MIRSHHSAGGAPAPRPRPRRAGLIGGLLLIGCGACGGLAAQEIIPTGGGGQWWWWEDGKLRFPGTMDGVPGYTAPGGVTGIPGDELPGGPVGYTPDNPSYPAPNVTEGPPPAPGDTVPSDPAPASSGDGPGIPPFFWRVLKWGGGIAGGMWLLLEPTELGSGDMIYPPDPGDDIIGAEDPNAGGYWGPPDDLPDDVFAPPNADS
jgi:hypothetical protein